MREAPENIGIRLMRALIECGSISIQALNQRIHAPAPVDGPTPAVGEPGLCPLACSKGSGACRGTTVDVVVGVPGKAEVENGSVKKAAVGLCTPDIPVGPTMLLEPI